MYVLYHWCTALESDKITSQLRRSKGTIKYELDCVSPYNALQAQLDYDAKRENCGCKIIVDLDDITHILDYLKKGWSPETIVGRYKNEHGKLFPISISSIYRYVKAGLFKLSQKLTSKSANETAKEIIALLKHLPKKLVKSITAEQRKGVSQVD